MASLSMQDYVDGMNEILTVLKTNKYTWSRCGERSQAAGMSADALLEDLLVLPQSVIEWNANLLNIYLTTGVRQGTLVRSDGYYINLNMLAVNNINYKFLPVLPYLCSPQLHPKPFVIY